MTKKIIFTKHVKDYKNHIDLFPPTPAIKNIANWYKDMPEYLDNRGKVMNDTGIPQTIKKCIPVFDALISGYILYTQADIQVVQEIDGAKFYWANSADSLIQHHSVSQAELHPLQNGEPFPKFMNAYGIKTPPGYSTLFIAPLHNPNKIFTILEGVVDTDKYTAPVNFPFVFNDVKWEGIIEAGTPMAQVIPFKRDSWKYSLGSEKDLIESKKITERLRSFLYNSYKKQFWSRKEYK